MILRLLRLEWSKFSKNTVVTLLTTFFFVFLPTSLFFAAYLRLFAKTFSGVPINILDLPYIWEYMGYSGNWIVFFFLGVLIIYTVTIDVSTKTMRQNIISGLSRQEYLFSKVLVVFFFSFLATMYYTLVSIGVGFFNTDNPTLSIMFDNNWAITRFWLMSFAYMNFALFLAFLFRKSGIAVFIYLTYILLAEPLIKLLVKKYIMDNKFTNYLPMNAAEDLMPVPIPPMAKELAKTDDYFLSYGEASTLTIIYAGIFLAITYYYFLKRDL